MIGRMQDSILLRPVNDHDVTLNTSATNDLYANDCESSASCEAADILVK